MSEDQERAKKLVGEVVDEVFEALDAEPGFFHYPMTNEEWNKLKYRLQRRLTARKRSGI